MYGLLSIKQFIINDTKKNVTKMSVGRLVKSETIAASNRVKTRVLFQVIDTLTNAFESSCIRANAASSCHFDIFLLESPIRDGVGAVRKILIHLK